MITQGKILSVQTRTHKEKMVADVIVQFEHPTAAVVFTLWNNSVNQGHHKAYQQHVGQDCYLAVDHDIFNGKLKPQLVTSYPPVPVATTASKPLAAAK